MPSAEQQKLATRRLTYWLENEKRIVTYRELSREVGCHVNTAKNLLLSYLKTHSSLAPTYLLTGPLLSTSSLAQTSLSAPPSPTATQSLAYLRGTQGVRIVDMDEMSDADRNSDPDEDMDEMGHVNDELRPGNDSGEKDGMGGGVGVDREEEVIEAERDVPRWGVVLVQQDGLEDKKGLFEPDTLSIHIYALSPAPVKDPALYLVPNLGLREHKAYLDPTVYGTITGEGFKAANNGPLKDGGMDWGAKTIVTGSNEESAETKTVEVKPTKQETKEVVEPPKAKEEPKVTVVTKEEQGETKPKPAKAAPKSKANKRIIASDDEDDGGNAVSAPPLSAQSSKSALEPTSSMARADDKAAMEAMMNMDFEMESEGHASPVKTKSSQRSKTVKDDGTAAEITVKSEPGTSTGKRKRRKVKKSESSMGADGYMVTKDVWVEESCSESESENNAATRPTAARKSTGETKKPEPPKPANKPVPKPAPAGGNRKSGQSTLAGFFKKK